LHGLKSFQEGKFLVQDDSSQWVARVLDPKPGESVLDLCAGVGGKSTHIAERMDNQGRVTAVDTSADRLSLLTENSRRLGAAIIHPDLLDAREAGKKYFESADRVLVDAPCSGLGVVRRRPDLRWSKREADVRETLPRLQADLLRAAALCLKPGGVLVYSTCTLEPEEDEGVVRTFLAERADFQIEPPPAPGATPEGYVQLWPHRHDTDGFFIARLRKSAQGKILKGNL
jgi:16S rRNA (cytosine967-C5)-methyltransferase